jgi:hypothetical protein
MKNVPDDGRVLYSELIKAGYSPQQASQVVIDAGLGADIGAPATEALTPSILQAGEMIKQGIVRSYAIGASGGLAGGLMAGLQNME